MKKNLLSVLLLCSVFVCKATEPGVDWWPQASQFSLWNLNSNNEMVFNGLQPSVGPAAIATIFGGLTSNGNGVNDYSNFNLSFDAFIHSNGSNTTLVLSSNNIWGGKGVVIEINKHLIQATNNFVYPGSSLISNYPDYQNNIVKQDAYNSFYVQISGDGVITVSINGFVCPITFAGNLGVLTSNSPSLRPAYFCTGSSPFKIKNVVASRNGVTKKYFVSHIVSAVSSDPAKGSVTGGGFYTGTPVTVVASPTAGNRFVRWTNNNVEVSTNTSYTLSNLTNDVTVVAVFKSNSVVVSSGQNKNISDFPNCSNCNISIESNASLVVDAATTINSLIVNADAKLDLSNNVFSVNENLIVKAGKNSAASVRVTTGMALGGNFKLIKTFDNSKWYFVSFPCDIAVNDIQKVSGSSQIILGTNWWIKHYDGANRASNHGATTNWKHVVAGETLLANKGYIIGLSNQLVGDYEIEFPLSKSLLTTAETNRYVAVGTYGEGTTPANHVGWNLIGMPYLSKYSGSGVSANYLTFHNGTTYSQLAKADVSTIQPFESFFVQASTAGTTNSLLFAKGGRQQTHSIASILSDEVIQLNVAVANNDDKTTLLFNDFYTFDYEINSDLEKWITVGAETPQIYSVRNNINYAFNAMPIVDELNIPIGLYSKNINDATISFQGSNNHNLSELWLHDGQENKTTDLFKTDYHFVANEGVVNNRFSINPRRISTQNKHFFYDSEISYRIINQNVSVEGLTVGDNIAVFNSIGQLLKTEIVSTHHFEFNVFKSGVYFIKVTNNNLSKNIKITI